MEINENIYKILLSKPIKNAEYQRISIISNGEKFQASKYGNKQVFHENLSFAEVEAFVKSFFGIQFLQYTAWDGEKEYSARFTKKGKILSSSKIFKKPPRLASDNFNKQKNHIIKEGEQIPALVDMGVFTKNYKVAMHDKFRQINRFIELIADETKKIPKGTLINIIDFGCGKSYLTFLVYHYFTKEQKHPVNICGLDLDSHVVEICQKATEKYGYDSLVFKQGDIGSQADPPVESWGRVGSFNIIISLHACNTATDHALYNAIRWNADLICAVPCCQHELRDQMNQNIFSEYGIIKERMASLYTDLIRAKLLEWMGYKTRIIEFTSIENTPKNLFIRAKKGSKNTEAIKTVEKITDEFGFNPTLLQLIKNQRSIT